MGRESINIKEIRVGYNGMEWNVSKYPEIKASPQLCSPKHRLSEQNSQTK